MTKNAIQKVLQSNYANGKVLVINTNIAVGEGINGVDYKAYSLGLLEKYFNNYPNLVVSSTQIKIKDLDDDFIVLEITICKYKYFSGKTTLSSKRTNILYLPLNNIVSLCYIDPYKYDYERLSM